MNYLRKQDLNWEDRYCYSKAVVFKSSDLDNIGAKFQIVKFKRNEHLKRHYHKTTVETYYILSGSGEIGINDSKFICSKDDIFHIEPNDVHEIITYEPLEILISKWNETRDDTYWLG